MISQAARQRRRDKREQQRQELQAIIARLQAAGMMCANCAHIGRPPVGFRNAICELDSDSEGYVTVERRGICSRHKSPHDPSGVISDPLSSGDSEMQGRLPRGEEFVPDKRGGDQ